MCNLDAKQADRLILDLLRLGHNPTAQQYRDLLPRLQPFLLLNSLEGADSPKQSDQLLSFLWATMGDAHLKFGELEAAATAYCFSPKIHPLSSVFDSYAKIAIERNLSDHYATAVISLVEGEKDNPVQPLWERIYLHSLWFLGQPRAYYEYFKYKKRRKWLFQELTRRLSYGVSTQDVSNP